MSPVSTTPTAARLALALQSNGSMSAAALAASLGFSQPTLSRQIASLGSAVERIGAARRARYALRRPIRHLGWEWPLYRITETGHATVWGSLRALHGGFRFVPAAANPTWLRGDYADGLFSGLPFFLQDIRPQGYQGRAIARAVSASLFVSRDPREWSDDDLVAYLLTHGSDLPGNLVLGDRMLERALESSGALPNGAIPVGQRRAAYVRLADAAQRGEAVGSSAGGEQPKFLAGVRRADDSIVSVLVKFSAADSSVARDRWADLLLCEHLAAELLRRHGISAARTQILEGGGRRFLEVERFDRIDAAGRRGVLTIGATDDAFVDESSSDLAWPTAAAQLNRAGVIDTTAARELRWRWCFGDLIGNADMHRSNTSLWFADAFPFGLTPSYDMLPMQFAPGAQGEISERTFTPRAPVPALRDVWMEAAGVAEEFWAQVAAEKRISPAFRTIARNAATVVRKLTARFG